MWWVSAPQQPTSGAITTSTPMRVSSRMVASLMEGASVRWAQPVSSATRARLVPSAAVHLRPLHGPAAAAGGRQLQHRAHPLRRQAAAGDQPRERPAEPGRVIAARNRPGLGSTRASTRRSTRSCHGRSYVSSM